MTLCAFRSSNLTMQDATRQAWLKTVPEGEIFGPANW